MSSAILEVPGRISGSPANASAEIPQPFFLGDGMPPVPTKLVGKILKGEFVDVTELLREAERSRNTSGQALAASTAQLMPCRREVSDLLSWVQCFGSYASMVAQKYQERVRQLSLHTNILKNY